VTQTTNSHPESERNQNPVAMTRRFYPGRRTIIRRFANVVRNILIDIKGKYLRHIWKMDIHPSCQFSLSANFDITNPRGVHVDQGTYVAFGAVILAHDLSRQIHVHTRVGKNCFIGANSIIMPGVSVGDECIVAAGSVVTRDIPSHSICAGNPAKIIKEGIRTMEKGIIVEAHEEALDFESKALEDLKVKRLPEVP
jgi:acetyltransferase-like isoleucine patch superfamily enzyme